MIDCAVTVYFPVFFDSFDCIDKDKVSYNGSVKQSIPGGRGGCSVAWNTVTMGNEMEPCVIGKQPRKY